jgi:2-polyprenyl-6-methoxyphenol hydroxylase-like FAD-dependent oxidoreductase
MSPVGGVGINLAIQDAVAAANLLAFPLLRGTVGQQELHQVQRRRSFPTRMTQALQVFIHRKFLGPALERKTPIRRMPLPLKLLQQFPRLRRIPARIVGLGFRAEHIRTPAAKSTTAK